MADDIILNRAEIIERCLRRIDEEYSGHQAELAANFTKQDSIILNLQRACEAAIDLAMHLVRVRRLDLPQESRDAYDMLHKAGILDDVLAGKMKSMVGFRNIAIHDYRELNLDILRAIIETRLGDFTEFTKLAIKTTNPSS